MANKGFLLYLKPHQHAFLKMTAAKNGTKITTILRDLIDDQINEQYPAVEYKQKHEELLREIEVVEMMIQESETIKDHENFLQTELERIIPNLAEGTLPTPELASYVSNQLGLSWKDFWAIVEGYRETGRVEV